MVFRYLFLSTALVRPCRNRTGDHGAWLAWNLTVFLPFLHSSLVWNNLFQIKYMIDSKNVVGLEIPIGFEFIFWKPKKKIKGNFCPSEVSWRETGIEGTSPLSRKCHGGLPRLCSVPTGILQFLLKNLSKSWGHMLYRETQYFGTSNALISDNN